MIESSDFRITRMPLSHGAGDIPFLGFGTLIPDVFGNYETIAVNRSRRFLNVNW
jgi:hypothetical protein